MRALLDTHAFLWFNFDDMRLSRRVRTLVSDGDNDLFVSSVSAWEIAIKYALKRLPEVTQPPESYVPLRLAYYGFLPLDIGIAHALRAGALPLLHRDPFDRLLVAQAQLEGLPILTSDPNIARYGVEVIW